MNEKQIETLKKIHSNLGAIVGGEGAAVEMSIDKFLGYAQEQVAKAIVEGPKGSMRLKALRGTIEKAITDFGAMIATNTDSESIKVTVYTEQTTAGDELSSKEITPQQAAGSAGGSGLPSFSMSKGIAKDAMESLESIKKALGEGASSAERVVKSEKVEGKEEKQRPEPTTLAKNDGVDNDGWPENLNDPKYRETRKSATAPAFGYDSDADANANT